MPEINVELNNTESVGLGDNLCLLSLLANIPPKVVLSVSNEHNTYNRLLKYAKIFRIPAGQLELKEIDYNGTFNNTGWPIKVFTDYFKPLSVNANGNVIQLNKGQGKKCVAIITAFDKDQSGRNEWPWCRNRPLDYWARIFAWVKSLGYEVITLDDPFHDLESKVEILAKNCCAVISYEGGMAHLAHMMNLPCFILDWKHPSSSTVLDVFHVDFVHRTNSVYILRNDEEIFSWDRTKFDVTLAQLREGNGNNRLVTGDFYFDFIGPNFHNDVKIYNKKGLLCLQTPNFLGKDSADFLYKFYQNR